MSKKTNNATNSTNSSNCESCDQIKSNNRANKINNNMGEIINSSKNISNLNITNFNSLSKNIPFNNSKIKIEYFNNNTKACPNC